MPTAPRNARTPSPEQAAVKARIEAHKNGLTPDQADAVAKVAAGPATGTTRSRKAASPFGENNFTVTVVDGVVTIQFALGTALGLSGSEKSHLVSKGDPTWKAPDGTRFSFTAYRKVPGYAYPGK